MALPNNALQQVQTYHESGLALLLNSFCGINLANKKFQNFQDKVANLGDTVGFDLQPRYNVQNTLVVSFQDSVQRVQPLTCSQQANVSYAFNVQQFIFNVREYMDKFGKSAILRLGSQIETDILKCITNGVVNSTSNVLVPNNGPYRFYGDGITPINSFTQLQQALSNFRDLGTAPDNTIGILPMVNIPAIVGSGLNQFATDRNNDLAMSWMLGEYAGCKWNQSNLLPVHIAGTVGEDQQVLTVVSTNDPTGVNITQITFSGATVNDADAVKTGDMFQFQDGVSGLDNLRFLNFTAYNVTAQPVQFIATADAGANGSGNVTVSLRTATNIGLVSANNQNRNLNVAIQAGQQVKALPSHRAGVIWSGNPFFLAMPALPEEVPFPTANKIDPDSGASIRNYYGSLFGQNQRGYVNDAIWGSILVPEYSFKLVFPL